MSRALWMASGVIVWALHFTIIYGFAGVACARGLERTVPWTVGLATIAAAGLATLILVRGVRRRGAFEDWISAGLASFALLAILWEGLAVFMVAPCGLR